jgi:glycosyltransferase involved in cell wall biosynthesis
MTKVLYCHPGAEMYGSDRMALETVRILQERGDQVTVVLPEKGELFERIGETGARVRVASVPVLRKEYLRPDKLIRMTWRSLIGMATVRKLIRETEAQLVIVNTITQPVWIYGARIAGSPVICHVREAEDSLGRFIRAVLVSPLSASSLFISNSKATDKFVRRSSLLPLPASQVVYNGKDWAGYFRTEPDIRTGSVRLVLVGRISPRKGHDTAIELLHILRGRGVDARLRIVGDVFAGYEWYKTELLKTLFDLGIDDYCSFAGFVTDVAGELESADIAIVPSRVEPFGTVAAESMAAMRCTIVAKVQGLVEIVQDRETGLCVTPDDPVAWADAVESLLDDPAAALVMAKAGRSHVLSTFSMESYAQGIISAVDRVDLVKQKNVR